MQDKLNSPLPYWYSIVKSSSVEDSNGSSSDVGGVDKRGDLGFDIYIYICYIIYI